MHSLMPLLWLNALLRLFFRLDFVRESLEDKVRRVRQGGSVYKWDGKEDKLGKTKT